MGLILYVLVSNCVWSYLTHKYPNDKTVYHYSNLKNYDTFPDPA